MPQYQTWEEFSHAAENLYLADPMKGRVVLKYRHSDGSLCIKVTDDLVCLVYRTDQAQDVKKIEKFHSQLMRLKTYGSQGIPQCCHGNRLRVLK